MKVFKKNSMVLTLLETLLNSLTTLLFQEILMLMEIPKDTDLLLTCSNSNKFMILQPNVVFLNAQLKLVLMSQLPQLPVLHAISPRD